MESICQMNNYRNLVSNSIMKFIAHLLLFDTRKFQLKQVLLLALFLVFL
jgi:hypothetical protein